jgi:pSer/pThr/pTyr-binding forkhead associated (FHA) protein/predicted Ser/Thr protein kinase
MDGPKQDAAANAVGQRAVALGILSDAQAKAALDQFRRQPRGPKSFADFLMDSGTVSRDDLAPIIEEQVETTAVELEPPDPLVGTSIGGARISRKLGQGGMGSVYLATREADGREVVIKLLASEQAANKTWRGRFEREARVMEQIRHPNIVELYSIDATSERPHIAMEFVDGEPLDAGLTRRGVFEPLEAARLIRDVARGLAEAHRAGVIHRDVKPANLLLAWSGEIKVLDFGLAKAVSVDDGLSLPGQVLGTPHYMAPEQWGDHQVDARCDVFSLGATLYHLVTGSLPFPGHSAQAISRLVSEGQFSRPRTVVATIPEDLELVILRAMEVERRFRYGSADQLADELDRVLGGQPVEAPRLVEASGKRHPLLPARAALSIGRDATSAIVINDTSVSRQHAALERGKTGYVLRDLGSSYGTFVGEMRIKEVVLKDGDPIRFGKVQVVFKDGGMAAVFTAPTKRIPADKGRAAVVVEPVLRALFEEADKRTVLSLIEAMAPDAIPLRVTAARQVLRTVVDGQTTETTTQTLEQRLRRARGTLAMRLFSLTHENLGDDVEAWLGWWDQARDRYPPQLALRQPRAPAKLTVVRPAPATFELDERTSVFAVGRDEKCEVVLEDRSVSRHHATVLRLLSRLIIRDEGSRFGTLKNGQPVRLAFLSPGDPLVMGKVELVFETETPGATATRTGADVTPIDDDAYGVLEEVGHPSVASALVTVLEREAALGAWAAQEAVQLFPQEPEKAKKLAVRLTKAIARRTTRARDLLPKLLGATAADPTGWRVLLEAKDEVLPPQVVPQGWPDPAG